MPQLLRYVEYIGGNKADKEIINSVVDMCDRQFVTINNMQILNTLLNLTDDDKKELEELKRLIAGLSHAVGRAIDDVRPFMDKSKIDAALKQVSEFLEQQKRVTKKNAVIRQEYRNFAPTLTNRLSASTLRAQIMETFKEIEQHLQPFINTWNEIIHGNAKG